MTDNFIDFSDAEDVSAGGSLIPKGTLAYARIINFEKKQSKGGKDMLECQIELLGQYNPRKLWQYMMLEGEIRSGGNAGKKVYDQITKPQIKAILAVNNFNKPDSEKFKITSWNDLNGMTCAIRVGIQKNEYQGEMQEQNTVNFLSALPDSSTFKDYQKLLEQDGNPPVIERIDSVEDMESVPF